MAKRGTFRQKQNTQQQIIFVRSVKGERKMSNDINKHDFMVELIKEWIKHKGSIHTTKIENLGDLANCFYDTKDFDWLIKNIVNTGISFNELVKLSNEALKEHRKEIEECLNTTNTAE